MKWKTENARRPDLEAIVVNDPTLYIGCRIFPVQRVEQQAGRLYYVPIVGGTAAQTGRTQAGGAIISTYLADASVTFSCGEYVARYELPAVSVGNFGGVERADEVGGSAAKKSVADSIEAAQAVALLGGTANVYAYSSYNDFFAVSNVAKQSINGCKGRTALVTSVSTLNAIQSLPEVKERLLFTGATSYDVLLETRSRTKSALFTALQGVFKVDEILIGDDDAWNSGDLAGTAFYVKLPNEDDFSYMMRPEFGRTIAFKIESGAPPEEVPVQIETWANESTRCDVYDGVSYVDIKTFNAAGRAVITGLAAAAADAEPGIPVNVAGGTVVSIDGGTVGA